MKKSLWNLLVVLLFVIVGLVYLLPYGLGFVAKHKYMQLLDIFAKSNTVQATLVDYQRGWFSSEATVKVSIPSNSKAENLDTLMVKQSIQHGPLFSITSSKGRHLSFGQALINTHVESVYGKMDCVNWIKINGGVSGVISIPKLHYVNTREQGDAVALDVESILGHFGLSTDLRAFIADFEIPRIAIQTGKSTQEIDGTKLSYDLQKSDTGLFLGKHAVSIETMVFGADFIPDKTLKLQKFKIDKHDEEKNHKITSEIDTSLQAITINNATYGPQQLVITIDQLDAPTLLALKKEANILPEQHASFEQLFSSYQQLATTLLRQGIEIQVKKFQMNTPWGAPSLTGSFTVPAQSATSSSEDFMNSVKMTAEINVSGPFLIRALEKLNMTMQSFSVGDTSAGMFQTPPPNPTRMAQQQITEWLNKKWLIPKNNGYQTVMVYQNRRSTLNGQPVEEDSAQNPAIPELHK